MQEPDIFMAKFRQQRELSDAKTAPASIVTLKPDPEIEPVPAAHWFERVKRFLASIFRSEDLDLETFEALEAKRTRHQIQQNRISRYF